jgi:hypothetical protein
MTSHDDQSPPQQRPAPDVATLAEIEQLDREQRRTLEDVLKQHPALTHREALDALKAAGL